MLQHVTARRLVALLPLLLGFFLPLLAQNPNRYTVFDVPLNLITTAQVSANLPNKGQSMHLLRVEFPASAGAVTPIQVRLEASFDGVLWVPISPDIITVPLLGGSVYAFEKAYGVFPAFRVRSVVNVPAGVGSMRVRYVGMVLPVANFLALLPDRYAF